MMSDKVDGDIDGMETPLTNKPPAFTLRNTPSSIKLVILQFLLSTSNLPSSHQDGFLPQNRNNTMSDKDYSDIDGMEKLITTKLPMFT